MFRILLFLILIVAAVLGFGWMKATSFPDWYDESVLESSNDLATELSKIIEKQGIEAFFGNKLSDLMAGKLSLDQDEFNALILSSLASDESGQRLLSISDIVKTLINQDQLEIGSIINMVRLKQQYPDIEKKVDKLTGILPILTNDKVYLAITGQPAARDGELAFSDNIALKVGNLTIPNFLLLALGASLEELQQQSIKLSYLKINDVSIENNRVNMAIRPSF